MRWVSRDRLWHRHFCWVPTRVDGVNVWLEYVWRRQSPFDYADASWPFTIWEYSLDIAGKWDEDHIYGPDLQFTTPYQRGLQ